MSNCCSEAVGQPGRVFTAPSSLATLKLGYAWRYAFLPDNNLASLLSISASTLQSFSVRVDDMDDLDLVLSSITAVTLSLRTLSIVARSDALFDLAALVNAFSTIDTLIIECPHSNLVHDTLVDVDGDLKLKRLIVNLRAGLYKSTAALESMLALPALAGLEVLVLRGSRYKAFAASDEGRAVLVTAEQRGIKRVFLRKG